ncbi:MAG: sugar phosphate isomerase/epimerase, partial [Armatimonadetes bacterium]|nr:sugar phosphate isomerase/epimerase [Armatimonadota bacterium]
LETMPWVYPDSPGSYLRLIEAVDRPAFAVHFDPVNLINCPERAFQSGRFLRHCFDLLGPYIRSCHAKDIILREKLTLHLDEARPGEGCLDYAEFLRQAARLPAETPIMLEHLPSADEYRAAASYLRSVAQQEGVVL